MYFLEEKYELAIKCFDSCLQKNKNDIHAFHSKGWALVKLGKYEEAAQCYLKSEKDILSTFLSLANGDINESIEEKKQLAPFLDIMLEDDEFFKLVTNGITENKEKYQKVYIKSIFITSLLYINFRRGEKLVAHYTNEKLAEVLFLNDSPLRLSLITKSNDPKEGQTLIDYFYKDFSPKNEKKFDAFATSFTFNIDHLNQFRLYGKSTDKIEAGGMSLIFNQSFFNTFRPDNSNFHETTTEQLSREIGYSFDKSNKLYKGNPFGESVTLPLFRCIYLDPDTKFVASIGQKEEYTFYQKEEKEEDEGERENVNDYKIYINCILKEVEIQLEELKRDVENLDPQIVNQLLLSLRYLTKDISFKEEQECRIIAVNPLSKAKICPVSGKKYFDYLKLKDDENKSRVEKIIYGNNCFKDKKKEESISDLFNIIEKIYPSQKEEFLSIVKKNCLTEEIDINIKRDRCIKEFKEKMKQVGVENIESSKWLFT